MVVQMSSLNDKEIHDLLNTLNQINKNQNAANTHSFEILKSTRQLFGILNYLLFDNNLLKGKDLNDYLKELQKFDQHLKKLNETLNELETLIEKHPQTKTFVFKSSKSSSRSRSPHQTLLELFMRLLKEDYDNYTKIHRRNRYPIPKARKIFDYLRTIFGYLPEEEFENLLFELEKKQIIDLQTASDPTIVPEGELGIKHPIRGTIYYIIWR